jgi:cell filamentation protein
MTLLKVSSYEKVSEEQLHPYSEARGIYANFFEITVKKELESLEREFSSVRQAELISEIPVIILSSIPEYLYSFKTYTVIHQRLFSDLYPWAGKLRAFDMGYDGHAFTKAVELVYYGEKVFDEFKNKVKEGFYDRAEFVKESARFLNLINTLHPFPNGNGRSQRNIISLHFIYHGFELN